mmetsp:Transcript_6876/g.13055  ORF Transcript_6876/g.13055 Transcript_6876/m.13055 type:complete len:91 (+) Transcript_6876:456-728(+)
MSVRSQHYSLRGVPLKGAHPPFGDVWVAPDSGHFGFETVAVDHGGECQKVRLREAFGAMDGPWDKAKGSQVALTLPLWNGAEFGAGICGG